MIELTSNYKFGRCDTNEEYLNYLNNSAVTTGAFVMYIKNNNKVKYTIITSPDSEPEVENIKYNYIIYNIYNGNSKLIYNCKDYTGKIFTSINDARANVSAYLSNLSYYDPCDYFKIDIIYEKYNAQNIIIDTGNIESFTYSLTVTNQVTDTTTVIEDTTTPSPYVIKYYYIIYNVYNDNSELIYNCKDINGYTFETINAALGHADMYLCYLDYSDPSDYFKIDIMYEKYNEQNKIIESNKTDTVTYTTSTTTSTSTTSTTTTKTPTVTVEPTGLVNNPGTESHTEIPYVILYTQDSNTDHYNYNKALHNNIMIDETISEYYIKNGCLIINDRIIPDSGMYHPFGLLVDYENKYISVCGQDYAEIGVLKDDYVFELNDNIIDLESLDIFDHSTIGCTTTSTTSTSTTSTTTTPSPDIIRYHCVIYSIYNDTEKLIYNCKNDVGYSFDTIDGAAIHAEAYLTNLNYDEPYDYFRIDIIYEKYNNQQQIITDTNRIDSFIYSTTTTPKKTGYNEFPTNSYTYMPVGVKIYTDNSQKSKENNKQLFDNYINYCNNIYNGYTQLGCTVLYVNDVIYNMYIDNSHINGEDIIMRYDNIDGGKLYLCYITGNTTYTIYTISSDGTITQ